MMKSSVAQQLHLDFMYLYLSSAFAIIATLSRNCELVEGSHIIKFFFL